MAQHNIKEYISLCLKEAWPSWNTGEPVIQNLLPFAWHLTIAGLAVGGITAPIYIPSPASIVLVLGGVLLLIWSPFRVWQKAEERADRIQEELSALQSPKRIPHNRDQLIRAISLYEQAALDALQWEKGFADQLAEHPDLSQRLIQDAHFNFRHPKRETFLATERKVEEEYHIAGDGFVGLWLYQNRIFTQVAQFWSDDSYTEAKFTAARKEIREASKKVRREIDNGLLLYDTSWLMSPLPTQEADKLPHSPPEEKGKEHDNYP